MAGLAILDPSTAPGGRVAAGEITALLAERLPLLPPLRWRLAEVPLGLDYPYWVDDPDFDLDYHVRELALAAPGTDDQLAEQVARIVSRPLDRARPLWELYLIHGLEGGQRGGADEDPPRGDRRAVAARRSWACCWTSRPRGASCRGAEPATAGRGPGPAGDARAAGCSACRATRCAMLRALPAALPNLEHTPFGVLPGRGDADRAWPAALRRDGVERPRPDRAEDDLQRPRLAAPAVRLRAALAGRREGGQERARQTVNDVVVAICAGAVRRWLIEHDELPDDAAGRPDPGLGAHGRRSRHLRQPDPADGRAAVHGRGRPGRAAAASPTRR